MKARILLGAGASVIALVALFLAGRGYTTVRRADRARAAIARNQAALPAALQPADTGAATDRRAAATPSAALAAPPAGHASGPSVASLLAADPKLMALYLKSFRATLADRYGVAYARLGLSPTQIDKFEKLITAQEADQKDLEAAAEAQGLSNDDPGIVAMRQQAKQESRAGMAAMALSAGISPAQLDSEKNLAAAPLQNLIGNLAATMTANAAPMPYAQAAQLAPILAAANTNAAAGAPVSRDSIDWDQVTAQATAVLSAPQLQALQAQAQAAQVVRLAREFDAQEHPAGAP